MVRADRLQRTTSYLAAAVWFPTAVGPPEAVARWGAATYDVLAAEAATGVPGWSCASRSCSVATRSRCSRRCRRGRTRSATCAWHVRTSYRPVIPTACGSSFPWWRCPLPALPLPGGPGGGSAPRRSTRGRTGRCAGPRARCRRERGWYGGRALVGDETVFPVRGQIVRVTNPGLRLSVRDEEHPGGRAYVHPRSEDCTLGGTLEVGSWDTEPDPGQTAAILDRCIDIAPQLAMSRVLQSVVGLRPGRPEVRVELDRELLPVPVIHNYGHGGAGITISWGCAQDVAALAKQLEATP